MSHLLPIALQKTRVAAAIKSNKSLSQLNITCSKSTIETLEKGVKDVQS